jgi:hypothetical protein
MKLRTMGARAALAREVGPPAEVRTDPARGRDEAQALVLT